MNQNLEKLVSDVLVGNQAALARAITIVEKALTKTDDALAVLELLPKRESTARRIGVSGIPGAGKSTLIETLGMQLVSGGLKVAVLAIDPSSAVAKGSILGDKTRMPRLSAHPLAFVRPTPSAGVPGGIAPGTFESVLLCEAAGFDVILVETVGVGQSEFLVEHITDLFLFLALPNTGDELQGLKRGITESIDLCFVNKVDLELPNINHFVRELESSLHQYNREPELPPIRVLQGSGISGKGVSELWEAIEGYYHQLGESNLHRIRKKKNRELQGFYLKELLYRKAQKLLSEELDSQQIPLLSAAEQLKRLFQT